MVCPLIFSYGLCCKEITLNNNDKTGKYYKITGLWTNFA